MVEAYITLGTAELIAVFAAVCTAMWTIVLVVSSKKRARHPSVPDSSGTRENVELSRGYGLATLVLGLLAVLFWSLSLGLYCKAASVARAQGW